MKPLEGKTAIVTGSARGLGKAMALKLASDGAQVVVTATTQAGVDKVAEEIRANGGEALPLVCNVTVRAEISEMISKVIAAYGKIDILVNNAGITRDASFMKLTEENWDAVLDTDLKSVFLVTQEAAKYMREAARGRVINITSMTGQMGTFGQANYGSAKAGIIGLTKTLALELGRKNISVNAVSPGLIDSDLTAAMPKDAYDANITAIPLGRAGKPEEVASLVAYLATDDAAFINGAVISINGGMYR
jgi:3-oxoacyl-[acyl-carrier protein] reductase